MRETQTRKVNQMRKDLLRICVDLFVIVVIAVMFMGIKTNDVPVIGTTFQIEIIVVNKGSDKHTHPEMNTDHWPENELIKKIPPHIK